MKNKLNKKEIIIIFVAFLTALVFLFVMFYINIKKEQLIDVEATVLQVSDHYIIVCDSNGVVYKLDTEGEYNIGDRILFSLRNIEDDSYPKSGTVIKLDTISKSIHFSIEDGGIDNSAVESNDNNLPSSFSEEDVVNYFENIDNNFSLYDQDKSIGESLKSGFVTIVDFLFYGGKIKDKTFDELSTSAKLKVLQLAFSIDKKIDSYFPGYKEEISKTGNKVYTNVKSKAVEIYLDITTSICENNEDTCDEAKVGLSNLKNSFSLTWDFVKEISGVGLSKLKAWYEVWKNC